MRGGRFILAAYLVFLLLPIYWLVNMSLKTNTEITTRLTLWPEKLTFANYAKIFTEFGVPDGMLTVAQMRENAK